MAFLNITVATICLSFAWILALMAIKGWAASRMDAASYKLTATPSTTRSERTTPRASHDDREDRHVAFVDSPTVEV